ncbi:MAG: peptide chain release factor 1 [Nitrospinota bacterium]
MLSTVTAVEKKYLELTKKLSDPSVITDRALFEKYAKEASNIRPIFEKCTEYKKLKSGLVEATGILKSESDPELKELAEAEIKELKPAIDGLESQMRAMLIPKDPNDSKNVIMEIRAGTGGDEAALFAADLFRLYSRYAEINNWKIEILSSSETEGGGFKEIIFLVKGNSTFGRLKYEAGTHRVQRVPTTEGSGRIHTSAVTCAILPEATELDITLDPNDLKIDVYRSSGNGGQSVNTTDSAVRITHLPTKCVVAIQDEKSQHKNRLKAMKILLARLTALEKDAEDKKRSQERKNQIGSGDRSERIRTYNFPQGRVTDHRIQKTLYKLESFMEGNIDEMIDALIIWNKEASLNEEPLLTV